MCAYNREQGVVDLPTNESVHVKDPVEGVDLSEGRNIHWEASIWEYYSEHFP